MMMSIIKFVQKLAGLLLSEPSESVEGWRADDRSEAGPSHLLSTTAQI